MRRAAAVLATAMTLLLLVASSASAAFGLRELDVSATGSGGANASQAGSHPFTFTTSLGINTIDEPGVGEVPEGEVKDLTIQQMPGLVGNPSATPRCTAAEFATRVEGRASCPDETAVGIAAVKAEFTILPVGTNIFLHVPLYNLVPSPGEPAKLGFVALNVPVTIDLRLSHKAPFNIVASLENTPQAILFYGSRVSLWGNPESSLHDTLRGKCVGEPLELTAEPVSLGSCPVLEDEKAFLTLPRACLGPLTTTFTANSWQEPAVSDTRSTETHDGSEPPEPEGMTGCDQLTFTPQIAASPTTESAESSSGIDVDIEVEDPGLESPTENAQSDIRKVEATFPEGVTVNTSAADGLGACTEAKLESASPTSAGCPESAKLGSVEIETPLLEEPLEGAVFVAQPDNPGTAETGAENPFDSLIALYLVVRSQQYGIVVTQAGKVEPDPKTGQLVSTFGDIPQLPFSHLHLHFREGPRAPLLTPPRCGAYATETQLTPWSGGEPVDASSTFTVNSGIGGGPCPVAGPPTFNPGFEAGSANNNAGAFSPFYMRLTRADGEQPITRFSAVLPSGVTGKIAGIARCGDAQIAAAKGKTGLAELASPSCPQSSEIGHVLAGAGVGSALTYVPGRIYLAGPFAGDPLSVVVITPAVAGPFDVGNVVVREALALDPATAEVHVDGAASDPIPSILKGVPLKLRDLRVYVDRQNFTLNPTSCDQESARATVSGEVPVARSARYQAANCSKLAFKPKLSLRLTGSTHRVGHPAIQAVVRARPGDANIGKAVVTLPRAEQIENAHINNPCTRPVFSEGRCPAKSVLGFARAYTPLLDEPLEGPVIFRANGGEHLLPDIVADLHGQFDIVLVGHIDAVANKRSGTSRVRTTFETVPDAPVTKFVLKLDGGRKGLLVNNSNICLAPQHARAAFFGQNGKEADSTPLVANSCRDR